MYPYHYYRQLNLPRVPDDILAQINLDPKDYTKTLRLTHDVYTWTDQFNEAINSWCQENICKEMYWAFQFMTGDLPIHKDNVTLNKFVYVIEPGGLNVVTSFYTEDHSTQLESIVLETHKWYILKVDTPHDVSGIEPGKLRFAITSRIF